MKNSPEFEINRQEMNLKLAERFLAAAQVNKIIVDRVRSGEWDPDIELLPIPRWSVLDDVPSADLPHLVNRLTMEWKRKVDNLIDVIGFQ